MKQYNVTDIDAAQLKRLGGSAIQPVATLASRGGGGFLSLIEMVDRFSAIVHEHAPRTDLNGASKDGSQ